MTSDKRYILTSGLAILLFGFIIAGFDSAFWPKFIPWFPAPMTWLALIVYVSLYRGGREGFILAYLLGGIYNFFTVEPGGMLIALAGATNLSVRAVKERVFWSGGGYFILAAAVVVPFFHFAHLILSWLIDDAPFLVPVFRWIGEIGTTAFMAAIIYPILWGLDRWLREEAGEDALGTME